MLITVSGMVGSGKSTTAREVVGALAAAGVPCEYIRFRLLGRRSSASARPEPPRPTAPKRTKPRGAGFLPRRLSALIACGYLARIILFRTFGPRRSSDVCYVVDRYFYDSFVHYELETVRERFYLRLLRGAIPEPDLSILLVASPATIAQRRPDYAPEYVHAASTGYDRLREQFPQLVAIQTDGESQSGRKVGDVLQDLLVQVRGRIRVRTAANA